MRGLVSTMSSAFSVLLVAMSCSLIVTGLVPASGSFVGFDDHDRGPQRAMIKATLHRTFGCGASNGVQSCSGPLLATINATECYEARGSYLNQTFTRFSLRNVHNSQTQWAMAFFNGGNCTRQTLTALIGPCPLNKCCVGLWQLERSGFVGCFTSLYA